MYKYAKEFPTTVIPHITDNEEINDIIHNYKKNTNSKVDPSKPKPPLGLNILQNQNKQKNNLALETTKPNLLEEDITKALKEIQSEKLARMIGLVCHLVYWSVFGHIN